MPQMLDLVKSNAVPATVMRSAAKGALSVPAAEMLQILVHLTHTAVFGQEAALTLARWDQQSALAVMSSPEAPQEVVEYFLEPGNRRPALMAALIENPRVSDQRLTELANSASRELVDLMLASARVKKMPDILQALLASPNLTEAQARHLHEQLGPALDEPVDPESESAHETWVQDHSAEIEAEEGTAFELASLPDEESEASGAIPTEKTDPATSTAARQVKPAGLSASLKVSTVVKLSRMNVAQRVKQGFLGNKEERSILIRDSARIVQNAVLASPKLSEPEVETFSAAKNVSENVLREIARSRRFIKIYAVVRNLVNNPRCPLDLSLTLVKSLLVTDLKQLQSNKNVPETLRRVSVKLYKEKSAPMGQRPE